MYAIVNVAGRQVKVEQGQKYYVAHLQNEEGSDVEFNEVLLLDNDGNIQIGKPFVSGVSVKATVVSHVKGPKIIVFKKKRRKGYAVKNGHRQQYTRIEVQSIG